MTDAPHGYAVTVLLRPIRDDDDEAPSSSSSESRRTHLATLTRQGVGAIALGISAYAVGTSCTPTVLQLCGTSAWLLLLLRTLLGFALLFAMLSWRWRWIQPLCGAHVAGILPTLLHVLGMLVLLTLELCLGLHALRFEPCAAATSAVFGAPMIGILLLMFAAVDGLFIACVLCGGLSLLCAVICYGGKSSVSPVAEEASSSPGVARTVGGE